MSIKFYIEFLIIYYHSLTTIPQVAGRVIWVCIEPAMLVDLTRRTRLFA